MERAAEKTPPRSGAGFRPLRGTEESLEGSLTDVIAPDPVIEVYQKDVDRTLIRENLKRTVTQRLENLMALQEAAEEMRRAGQRAQARE